MKKLTKRQVDEKIKKIKEIIMSIRNDKEAMKELRKLKW